MDEDEDRVMSPKTNSDGLVFSKFDFSSAEQDEHKRKKPKARPNAKQLLAKVRKCCRLAADWVPGRSKEGQACSC